MNKHLTRIIMEQYHTRLSMKHLFEALNPLNPELIIKYCKNLSLDLWVLTTISKFTCRC